MCRGGKDGKVRRCKVADSQRAAANLRKKIKYRADKEGLTVQQWKEANPSEASLLSAHSECLPTALSFQPVSDTRRLADGIPAKISEHIEMSMEHIQKRLSDEEQKALAGYTGFAAGVANTVLLDQQITEHTLYDEAPLWRESPSGPCDFAIREDLIDYLNTMDNILSERHEEQRVLYRGIPIYTSLHDELEECIGKKIHVTDTEALLEGLQEYYKPGKVFKFSSYVSTTHSAFYAADRTQNDAGTKSTYYDKPEIKGIMLEMKTNAGLDVTGVARHNAYEREVVLPRDSRYRVESITLKPESYDTVSGYDHMAHPEDLEAQNFKKLAIVVQMVEVDEDGKEIVHADPHKPAPLNLQ